MTKRKSELAGLCFDRHGFTCGSSPASRLPPPPPASLGAGFPEGISGTGDD